MYLLFIIVNKLKSEEFMLLSPFVCISKYLFIYINKYYFISNLSFIFKRTLDYVTHLVLIISSL